MLCGNSLASALSPKAYVGAEVPYDGPAVAAPPPYTAYAAPDPEVGRECFSEPQGWGGRVLGSLCHLIFFKENKNRTGIREIRNVF